MGYPSWQSAREETSVYRPRRPWDSPLYKLIYNYREEFEYRYDELFEQQYGFLHQEVLDGFDRFLNCGILRHGAARARCEKCDHSILIPFSCKVRGVCNSCQAKRTVLFAENLHENVLLEQTHRHVIFSLPKRLRIYFRFDRSLFKHLYRAAWETWDEYVHEQLPGGTTGAVMALHTSGELLQFHPHLHTIALNGILLDDDHFCELPNVDNQELQERFAEKVFAFLLQQELITQDVVEQMNSWEHSGFNVYAGEPISGDNENARLFLARYLKKAPLAVNRLSIDESGLAPTVIYSKMTDEGKQIRTFSPLQFLAELSLHVPQTWEQLTRWYGCYSGSTRGKVRREAQYRALVENNFQPLDDQPTPQPATSSWARAMKRVFEIDPLRCSRCGETMKIIAFIHKPSEIEKIANHLGYPTWRAPPPLQTSRIRRLDTSQEFSQL